MVENERVLEGIIGIVLFVVMCRLGVVLLPGWLYFTNCRVLI